MLRVIWCGYDGARGHMLDWLEELAQNTGVEFRAAAAQAIGILAQQDLHEYLQPWGWESSMLAQGLNVAGGFGNEQMA